MRKPTLVSHRSARTTRSTGDFDWLGSVAVHVRESMNFWRTSGPCIGTRGLPETCWQSINCGWFEAVVMHWTCGWGMLLSGVHVIFPCSSQSENRQLELLERLQDEQVTHAATSSTCRFRLNPYWHKRNAILTAFALQTPAKGVPRSAACWRCGMFARLRLTINSDVALALKRTGRKKKRKSEATGRGVQNLSNSATPEHKLH